MRFTPTFLILIAICLTPLQVSVADDTAGGDARQKVRLKSGTIWRGRVGEIIEVEWKRGPARPSLKGRLNEISRLYLKVTPEGSDKPQIILVDYITKLKTLERLDAGGDISIPSDTPKASDSPNVDGAQSNAGNSAGTGTTPPADQTPDLSKRGLFILPLSGTVGIEFRPEEIEAITRQADARGDGQVIVLEINSGGGLVAEGMIIKEAITDASKRHTVVAWIDHAISGASWTALCCDLIIFKRHGHTGGITIMIGNETAPEATVMAWLKELEKLLIEKNRPKYWARPFVVQDSNLSATKDPHTGEVKWFPDLSGEKIFSGPGRNLMFNASEAVEYGFAYGLANSPEELAQVLQLNEWELAGTGQALHDERYELKERFQAAFRMDQYELSELGGNVLDINKRIKIFESWLMWWKKVPNQCRMGGMPPKDRIKSMIEEQRYALRQIAGG